METTRSNRDIHSKTPITGLEIDPYDNIIIATGRKRSGKSALANELSLTFQRVIIWDANAEHEGTPFNYLSFFDKSKPVIVYNLKDLAKAWSSYRITDPRRIIYRPLTKSKEHFNEFCKFINDHVVYCCIYIEELQNVTTANSIPPEFNTLESSGRHRKCGLLLTCRGNKNIPTRLFDDADFIFMFKQRRPETYEYMKEYADNDLVDLLKQSPDYYFLMIDANAQTLYMKPLKLTTPSTSQHTQQTTEDKF